jgi:threonylcarbamoyladenosine tRNA methylthiotransferase MtaB
LSASADEAVRPGVEVVTFGCRLNAYESEVMRRHARAAGLADAVIVNTCAVTAEAERQARQAIRRIRRERPDATVIVTGCAAQIDPGRFAAMPEVDRVLGNDVKLRPDAFGPGEHPRVEVNDIMEVRETAAHLVDGFDGRARAFVQVQQGCDHRCTFCIIPYGRGNSRSVPIGDVVAQVRALVAAGYREVVLTGVDVTSYGPDLPGAPTLGQMARRLLALVPELPRLRLSSLDPVEMDEDLWRLVAEEPRLMPHLHMSLQAGSDMVLKRMKRRHLRADAVAMAERARRLRPDIALGADLIAGFPTEDEAMFGDTLAAVEECGLAYLHVFPYSPRPGTPAAKMPQVPGAAVRERAARLRAAGDAALARYLATLVGREADVLVEKPGLGRTEHFAETRVPEGIAPGTIVRVRIEGTDGRMLEAAPPSPALGPSPPPPLPGGERGDRERSVSAAAPSPPRGEGRGGGRRRQPPVGPQASRYPRRAETGRARDLRRESTPPERLLWAQLRHGRVGEKVRRQEPIGGLTVDFACRAARLVIEVDGGSHDQTIAADASRDALLRREGFEVLRIPAAEVMANLEGVVETIRTAIAARTAAPAPAPPGRPSPCPSPRGGEGTPMGTARPGAPSPPRGEGRGGGPSRPRRDGSGDERRRPAGGAP